MRLCVCRWWWRFGLLAAGAVTENILVDIGANPTDEGVGVDPKCVVKEEGVYCAVDSGDPGMRPSDEFDDTFSVVITDGEICVTRTNAGHRAGWDLILQLNCTKTVPTSTATSTATTSTTKTTTSMTSVTTTTTTTATTTTTVTTTSTTSTTTTSSSSRSTTTTPTTTTMTTTTTSTSSTTGTTTSSTRTATTGTTTTTTSTSSTTGTSTSSTTTATTGTTTSSTSTTTGTNTSSTRTATTGTTTTTRSTSSTTRTNTSSTITGTTATTTTTSSSATNTTWTDTTTTMERTAAALVDRVEALEPSLVEALVKDNLPTLTVQEEGGLTLVATKIGAAAVAAAGGNLAVPLENSKVAVTVPVSLFSSLDLGEEPVVITVATLDLLNEGLVGEPEVQVAAVVNINLLSLAGRRFDVANLPDPIELVMPVNHSAGLECVYWDGDSSTWATTGMELGSRDEGIVECKATHLTLFAAVLRGFVNTFACSQVTLLNADSIKELTKGNWHKTVAALAFWCLLASFTLLMSVAAWLDQRGWRQGRSDENFLVPLQAERQVEQPQEGHDSGTAKHAAACCVVGGVLHLRQRIGAAARALLGPMGTHRGHDGAPVGGRVGMLIHHLTSTVLVMSARRQVAASLGVSGSVSSLVMEDDDVFDVVLSHLTRELDPDDADPSQTGGASFTTLQREKAWGQLHQDMEAKIDTFMAASARWSALPWTVWLLFLHHNPLSMCLVHCPFTSCKQRVLLFEVRLVGGLMLVTVFFTASGVPKKQGRSLDCVADDPFEVLGRALAVGTASLLVAGIPAFVFRSLCTRSLKKFEYEGCPKWNRQLKLWRMQDRAIWTLSFLYLAFCVFFVCLFLANVDPMDYGSWLLSGLTSVVQKLVLIPFTVALTLPLVATVCLQFMSCHRRTTKTELVSALRLQFKSRVNMNMTVGMI